MDSLWVHGSRPRGIGGGHVQLLGHRKFVERRLCVRFVAKALTSREELRVKELFSGSQGSSRKRLDLQARARKLMVRGLVIGQGSRARIIAVSEPDQFPGPHRCSILMVGKLGPQSL